jgi:hypothetical protein
MIIRDDSKMELASEDDLKGMTKLDDCSDVKYIKQ